LTALRKKALAASFQRMFQSEHLKILTVYVAGLPVTADAHNWLSDDEAKAGGIALEWSVLASWCSAERWRHRKAAFPPPPPNMRPGEIECNRAYLTAARHPLWGRADMLERLRERRLVTHLRQ